MSPTCARCRRAVPDTAAFCPSCGAAVGGELEIELDDAPGPTTGASEVVFERGSPRSRWAGAGVAVALAVAIGAAVASGGGDGDRTAPTTTTGSTVARTTSTTTAPPTTTAATGPTTSPAPTTTTTIEVRGAGAPLLGEPVGARLLLTSSRGVVRLDLDAGTAAPVEPGGRLLFAEDLLAVRGGFLSWSQGTITVVRPDGADGGRSAPVPGGGQMLGTDAAGTAWVLLYGEQVGPSLARLADASSDVESVDVPWWPTSFPQARPDGAGGLVQAAGGGVFRWEDGGQPVGLAEGTVVDAAGGFVLTERCFPDPACTFTVTDVRGGTPRSLAVTGDEPPEGTRISPDGRWLVTNLFSFGPDPSEGPLVLRAVTSGRTVELPVADGQALRSSGWMRSRLAWTADGRWLFYVSDARTLRAWRDGLDAPIDIVLPDESLTGGVAVEVPA